MRPDSLKWIMAGIWLGYGVGFGTSDHDRAIGLAVSAPLFALPFIMEWWWERRS